MSSGMVSTYTESGIHPTYSLIKSPYETYNMRSRKT